MITKDWVAETARQIKKEILVFMAGERTLYEHALEMKAALNEEYLVTIINANCPFKEGVAYMSVPRCETCRDWNKAEGQAGSEVGR